MIRKRKVFFVWNMNQEKEWLEQQAKQGLVLERLGLFKYYFTETDPQDLVYQFDFQILSKDKEQEYLDLFQDWTFVSRYGGWYYFYTQKDSGKTQDIYMNNQSRRSLFRRLLGFLLIVAFPLYYQIMFVFPNMDPARLEYPNFYFFARIVIVAFFMLWVYAVVRIIWMYKQFRSKLKE